jgi:hypothetical protein
VTLQPVDDGSANSLLFLAREGVCLYLCFALDDSRTGLIILRTKTLDQKEKKEKNLGIRKATYSS